MKGKKWYSDSYRRCLADMHIEDWNDEFLAQFDPRAYFENLRRAKVRSPMLYVQSHVGYCYWPAEDAHMHKAFVGRETAMRELFELCRGAGMDVVAYYSLIYNNWAYAQHPDWRMRTYDGKGSRDNGSRYGLCCPNNRDYRQFVLRQIDDFCNYFDFEGVFFDMTFWPMVCTCESCRERWKAEAGGELPLTVDWRDARWRLFQQKREEWLGEFARLTAAQIRKHKPACSVEHQNSTDMSYWRFGVNLPMVRVSDYVGGDLYGGIAQQSFACKLYYSLTPNPPFEYMTSRCYPGLREHTTTKTYDMLLQSVLLTYAHHGAALLIDAMDPRGTLDGRFYDLLGRVFDCAKAYEPFLEGELAAEVGIFYSLSGKMDPDAAPRKLGTGVENDKSQPHLDAALGAARALRSRHIPFKIVPGGRLDLLKGLKVLILPDVPFMDTEEMRAVRNFVSGGGRLYFSRYAALPLAEEIFGLQYDGLTEESTTYLSPTPAGNERMLPFTPDYPMTVFAKQARLMGTPRAGVEPLATITLPYTSRMAGDFMQAGEEGDLTPYGQFAAIHSDPPGIRTCLPALLYAPFGKGRVFWAAAPVETADRAQHGGIFARIIEELAEGFALRTDAPEEVELVMFRVPETGRELISCVNTEERFELSETKSFTLRVRSAVKPARVAVLPGQRPLPFTYAQGETVIHTDSFTVFQMIIIDYTKE